MNKKSRSTILRYVILVVVGIIMIYPVVWLFFASFKSNDELLVRHHYFLKHLHGIHIYKDGREVDNMDIVHFSLIQ